MGAQVDVGDVTGQCGGVPCPGDSCAEVWREPACFEHRRLCGERRSEACSQGWGPGRQGALSAQLTEAQG